MSEEISLSVEETNALRVKLGLKPLKPKPDHSDDQRPPSPVPVADILPGKKQPDDHDKEDGKRLVHEMTSGGGVLDVFGDASSTTDWLTQHKKKLKTDAEENESHTDSESSSDSGDDEGESSESLDVNSD